MGVRRAGRFSARGLVIGGLLLSTGLFVTAASAAATLTIDFEGYSPGDVNGQNGWSTHPSGNSPTTGAVVAPLPASPAGTGSQVLQASRVAAMAGVSNGLNSPTIDGAGESGPLNGGVSTGGRNRFTASLWFATPATPIASDQPLASFLQLNPSFKNPGDLTANRYGLVALNNQDGVLTLFSSYPTPTGQVTAGSLPLAWGQWYRVDYDMRFFDGLATDGGPNDTLGLRVAAVGGAEVGTICSASYEAGYVGGGFGGGEGPRAVNGFDFLSRSGPDGVVGYVDNLSMETSTANIGTAPGVCTVASDTIDATDDSFGKLGGNVLTNDTINANPINPADVALTLTADGGLTGATLDPDGKLNVPGAAAPGTYTLTYEVCQNTDPTNCDTASITVTVQDGDADNDGLPDSKELALGSGVNDPDTDNDRIRDGVEYNGFTMAKKVIRCNRVSTAIGRVRTNLLRRDTDGDGLTDTQEVGGVRVFQKVWTPNGRSYILRVLTSHPSRMDTDFDGLKDRTEVTGSAARKFNFVKTDPANCHTDFGRRSDGYELSRGKNPVRAGEA